MEAGATHDRPFSPRPATETPFPFLAELNNTREQMINQNRVHQQQVNYGNAEARGKLRVWKNLLHQRYQILNAVFNSPKGSPLDTACIDLVKRGSRTGRRRAVDKLQQVLGRAAKLEKLQLDGKYPYALWSILKPRDPVTVDVSDETGLNQFCVTVNYILAGYLPHFDMIGKAEGLWGLEVPDHALGRAVERSGLLHPETIIRDAHRNLLELPATAVALDNGGISSKHGFFVRGGAGAFRGEIRIGREVSLNDDFDAHVFVRTWVDDARLHDDQVILCEKGAPGARLGDCWLLPRPFRRIIETAPGRVDVAVWQP
jgi:hypothetical protein